MNHVIKSFIVIFGYLIYLSSKKKKRFILSYHSTIIIDAKLILHNHDSMHIWRMIDVKIITCQMGFSFSYCDMTLCHMVLQNAT